MPTLDPAILERLVLDQAAEALDPDVSALLAAWLDEHPADAAAATALVTDLAGIAAALHHRPAVLPPWPQRSRPWRRWTLAAAALLVTCGTGFLVRWPMGRLPQAEPRPPEQPVEKPSFVGHLRERAQHQRASQERAILTALAEAARRPVKAPIPSGAWPTAHFLGAPLPSGRNQP